MAELRTAEPDIMGWAEFAQWAHDHHGLPIPDARRGFTQGPTYRAAWAVPGTNIDRAGPGTGTGRPARYGPAERRRVACWARMRPHVAHGRIARWLAQAAEHADGYLMDDGSGVRWVSSLEPIRAAIAAGRAVAAVRCGE